MGKDTLFLATGLGPCAVVVLDDKTTGIGGVVHVKPYTILKQSRTREEAVDMYKDGLAAVMDEMVAQGASRAKIVSGSFRSPKAPDLGGVKWADTLLSALDELGLDNTELEGHNGRVLSFGFDTGTSDITVERFKEGGQEELSFNLFNQKPRIN